MGDVERSLVLDQFRALIEYERIVREDEGLAKESGRHEKQIERKVHVLVMTDACLPTPALGEAPLGVHLLLNYELPVKKEAYVRRIGACFGPAAAAAIDKVSDGSGVRGGMGSSPVCSPGHGGGIVVNFLTASEVPLLRSIEEGCGICMDEMPIHICELL
ncbi:hypothetical protein CBR_g37151 [Chara braunii]|uniref:Helicase C-terminal domain-containing protein n=1 Tax=Chara braunii TaxID=69332 RepID=A0A388LM95_CHABU|nr:hypothetical protein CBR_g37151 [Chara braunii]|eukprot:GBG83438.1 hypothetical protein CBR_g37151 [Chara braunii]